MSGAVLDSTVMLRALGLLTLFFSLPLGAAVQDGRVELRVSVVLVDADGSRVPVPRHVLLVSDEPPSEAPRRVRTALDGTATIRLRPGKYMVESDQPIAFNGKAYQWRQTVDVAAGRDAVLELAVDNAEVSAATEGTDSLRSPEPDPSSLLMRWQDSVVGVWSATSRISGFLVDARGLLVTSQRGVGAAPSVEVQLAPATKVYGRVLLADAARDVAVVWVDPETAASIYPVPLGCEGSGTRRIAEEQEVSAIGSPLRASRRIASGRVLEIEGRTFLTDIVLREGGAGGPVFAGDGHLVGITTLDEEDDGFSAGETRVIRVEEVCTSIAAAEVKMKDAAAPDPALLPVEPEEPFPPDALAEAANKNARSVDAYRLSSSSYDVTFVTPPLLYAARKQPVEKPSGRTGAAVPDPRAIDPLDDFSNWSAYVRDMPPVLMIRVTPKLVEGFWTKVARGAARTRGVSLPPIKRFKPGFERMQVLCGATEVMPIHPFRLVQRVSESDAIYEGLYVFGPAALGPQCGSVKLTLYSEKDSKGETSVVDAVVLQRIRDDFAPYRALDRNRQDVGFVPRPHWR